MVIPPPDDCPFCTKKYEKSEMRLVVFKATKKEEIKWKDLLGMAPYKKWMCKDCYKIVKEKGLNELTTEIAILFLEDVSVAVEATFFA